MSDTNTGGPAFPAGERFEGVDGWHTEPGMTLRDYFAAKAMQSLILGLTGHDNEIPDTAEDAYEFADAMLRAREAA
jgi:hypothetical protein